MRREYFITLLLHKQQREHLTVDDKNTINTVTFATIRTHIDKLQ